MYIKVTRKGGKRIVALYQGFGAKKPPIAAVELDRQDPEAFKLAVEEFVARERLSARLSRS